MPGVESPMVAARISLYVLWTNTDVILSHYTDLWDVGQYLIKSYDMFHVYGTER